jgi:hypothetical protein
MQHFGPHAVDNRECNLRPVLRRIDVDAERTFAEGRVHDLDDCFCNCARIGILRNDSSKCLLDFSPVSFIGSRLVFSGPLNRPAGRNARNGWCRW